MSELASYAVQAMLPCIAGTGHACLGAAACKALARSGSPDPAAATATLFALRTLPSPPSRACSHTAAELGHEAGVESLLRAGASTSARNNHGATPLFYACM